MAYTITLPTSDGVGTPITINDGTINTTTSLKLIGKNYAGYGEFLNDNFVKLLSNFADDTQPNAPLPGQCWWDLNAESLKVYNGTSYKSVSGATINTVEPASAVSGDFWWNSTDSQLYVYAGAAWVLIGPSYTSSTGQSGTVVGTLTDDVLSDHVVVYTYVENNVVSITSADSTYTIDVPSPITGFTVIQPGINMVDDAILSGVKFVGTASNSTLVGELDPTQFLRADVDDETTGDLTVRNVNPAAGSIFDIGAPGLEFQDIYADTFHGSMADIAERFESDDHYATGTIMVLGGEKEITMSDDDLSDDIFGVISTKPGYIMNAAAGTDNTHPPIAMQGRVPVRVIGQIRKGDRLVSAGKGLARAGKREEINSFNVIGRSLEDKYTEVQGVVEAIVSMNT